MFGTRNPCNWPSTERDSTPSWLLFLEQKTETGIDVPEEDVELSSEAAQNRPTKGYARLGSPDNLFCSSWGDRTVFQHDLSWATLHAYVDAGCAIRGAQRGTVALQSPWVSPDL